MIFTILGALVAGLPAPEKAADSVTQWNAAHTLLVSNTSTAVSTATQAFNQLTLFATTGPVPERAAAALGYNGSPPALASQVAVRSDQQTGAVRISTTQATEKRLSPSPTPSPVSSLPISPNGRTSALRIGSPPRSPGSMTSRLRSTRSSRRCCFRRRIQMGRPSKTRWLVLSSMRSAANTARSSSSTTPSRPTNANWCSPPSRRHKASPSRSAASALHARGCRAGCSVRSSAARSASASPCCSPEPIAGSARQTSSPRSWASRSTRRSLQYATTSPTNSPFDLASTGRCRTRIARCGA